MKPAVIKVSIPFELQLIPEVLTRTFYNALCNYGKAHDWKYYQWIYFSKYGEKPFDERPLRDYYKSQIDEIARKHTNEFFDINEFIICAFVMPKPPSKSIKLIASLVSEKITLLDVHSSHYICVRGDKSENYIKGEVLKDVFNLGTGYQIFEYKPILFPGFRS